VCGRYVSTTPPGELARLFGAVDDTAASLRNQGVAPLGVDYNVAPTKSVPAVVHRGGTRRLVAVRWGLVPPWARDPSMGSRLMNARAETAASKPAFRGAVARRRCLLPADGWYEWQSAARPKAAKQPYFLGPADGGLLAMAGLYEIWTDAEDRALWTSTVLTIDAADDLGRIHDRAPMMLSPDQWDAWLDPATSNPLALQRPAVLGAIRAVPVSTEVNNARNNGPQLLDPVDLEANGASPITHPVGTLFHQEV
jgi:putative SOS response-associated peptidase YedK